MSIGRISGPMLKPNLERQGVDLSVETDLLYIDVSNNRIGVNNAVPTVEFDLLGVALFNQNLQIDGTTISSVNSNANIILEPNGSGTVNVGNLTAGRVIYAGVDGALIDNANLTFDGTNLYIGGNTVLNSAQLGNLDVTDNTISSTNTNGNIVLDPNGVGTVNLTNLTSGRVVLAGTDGALVDSANLTFDGTSLYISGDVVLVSASLGNISINANTISSTNTNGNIVLNPNGVGDVIIDTATANQVFYSGSSKEILTSSVLTFNGTTFAAANISIAGSTISNTDTDGDLTIDVNGTGTLIVDTTTAIKLPMGTSLERPADIEGYVRYNTDTDYVEYYNGASWLSLTPAIGVSLLSNYSGDGSTTGFVLAAATTTNNTIITLNGVVQSPGNAYTISGTALTFTEAPRSGDDIEVRFVTTEYTAASIIQDNDTSVRVNDTGATVVTKINNTNVVVTTASSTTFSGSILGTGSIASITTSVPANNNSSGVKGQIAYDSSYVYICVAANTWIRSAIQNTF